MNLNNFISELKRRNVFRVATAYAIAGWLIIQVFATIAPQLGFPEWIAPFVTTLVLIGFPLALIFAWAFELTPEGLMKSNEVEITDSVTTNTGKKLNKLIISVLSVALLFLLTERIFFAESTLGDSDDVVISQASIAVLPFADLSPEGDQEYFSDGLSEELLNVLAKVEDMKVAGRTSSFKFKGQNENLKLIGSELDVDHILEGSVRKAGNRLRITAQLIKVEDGFHMWSETYDREYTAENIFDIQDEISQMVLSELKVRLLDEEELAEPLEELPTNDTEAYEAFIQGNLLLVNRDPKEIEQAITRFERAIQLDPNYAEAYARLAISYLRLHEYGSIEREKAKDLIRENADQALLLDNNLGMAYAGIGGFYELELDWDKSKEAYRNAYELNPNNPEILIWYSNRLVDDQEERDLAFDLVKKANEIDPLAPIIIQNLASEYVNREEFEKALEVYERNIEVNPDYIPAKTAKIDMIANSPFGRIDESIIEHHKFHLEHPDSRQSLVSIASLSVIIELSEIASYFIEKTKVLYPDNADVHVLEYVTAIRTLDYDLIVEKGFLFDIEDEDLEDLRYDISFLDYMYEEKYAEAFDLLKTENPHFLDDTISVVPDRVTFTLYRILFDKVGETQQADLYAALPCSSNSNPYVFGGDLKKESTEALESNLYCLLLARDYRGFLDSMEETYLIRNSRILFVEPALQYIYQELADFDDPKNILQQIEEDRSRMRENVLAYLKTTDDWRDEWEEE